MDVPLLLQVWFLPDVAFPRLREQPQPELTRWVGKAGALLAFVALFFLVMWQPPILCLAPFLLALMPFVLLLEPGTPCIRSHVSHRCVDPPIMSELEKRGFDREAVKAGLRTLSAWSDTLYLIPAAFGFLALLFPHPVAWMEGAYRALFLFVYLWRSLVFFFGLAAYFELSPRTLWRFYLPSYLFLGLFLLLIALLIAPHLLH